MLAGASYSFPVSCVYSPACVPADVSFPVVYFFWPETARLSLEEIAAAFGDEVAIDFHVLTEEQRNELDERLKKTDLVKMEERVDDVVSHDTESKITSHI